jgi:hypothetical protein
MVRGARRGCSFATEAVGSPVITAAGRNRHHYYPARGSSLLLTDVTLLGEYRMARSGLRDMSVVCRHSRAEWRSIQNQEWLDCMSS